MSRFFIAVLFFLSLGLLPIKVAQPIKIENNLADSQDKTWTEWALKDFNNQKNNPAKIVIIGSSLVLTPVNLADAHFHKCTVDGALHHKSDLLRSFINEESHKEIENFSFALPGLMPSDAYLLTKYLLTVKDRPKLLIYGVGPRDFVDNLLASPASTDPYRCLSRYLSTEDKEEVRLLYSEKSWQSQLDYCIAQHSPLYGQKNEILAFCFKQNQKLFDGVSNLAGLHDLISESKFTIGNLHNLLPSYNPMAIAINECLFQPEVRLNPDRFSKSLDEYRMRYGKINWDTFTCQSHCFLNVLKLARDNGIKVLVVAMPITSVNRELLPGYILNLYQDNLKVMSESFGAHYLDLDDSHCFNDKDFGDTVHLSTTGSTKMIRLIADYIVAHNLDETSNDDKKCLAETGVKL